MGGSSVSCNRPSCQSLIEACGRVTCACYCEVIGAVGMEMVPTLKVEEERVRRGRSGGCLPEMDGHGRLGTSTGHVPCTNTKATKSPWPVHRPSSGLRPSPSYAVTSYWRTDRECPARAHLGKAN